MLEELFEDNLIGDPNDLEEIIEQQGDELSDEAEEVEEETEGNPNSAAADGSHNANATRVEPKKRTVKNPRLKLDPERLKGTRGIAVIGDAFKDFKFQGKGYEKVDLNRVMKKLEHWAHRLYPRFQFDDCLDKIEKLGQKKPVQVYVKKIRLGMETVEEPVVMDDDVDEPELNNEVPIDVFDELLSQQLSQVRPDTQTQAASSSQVPSLPDQELTAVQRERILRNKLIAAERRLARMKERHEIHRTAEMELSTSSAISVSNNDNATSSDFTSEIDPNNTDAEEANVPSTSVFSKAVEFEGTSTVFGLSVSEDNCISTPTELGKIMASSQPVDTVETNTFSVPSSNEQTDTAVMSLSGEEVNTSSGPIVGQETSSVCMIDDSEQTFASSLPVHDDENDVSSLPLDTKETYATSLPIDSEEPDVISMPLDSEETYCASMPIDSEEPDVISMPLDTEEIYATSLPTDSETTDVTSMSVDAEQTDTTSVLLNTKDNDATSMSVDSENTTSSLSLAAGENV